MSVCVRACVRARARARVCVCVCVRACVPASVRVRACVRAWVCSVFLISGVISVYEESTLVELTNTRSHGLFRCVD